MLDVKMVRTDPDDGPQGPGTAGRLHVVARRVPRRRGAPPATAHGGREPARRAQAGERRDRHRQEGRRRRRPGDRRHARARRPDQGARGGARRDGGAPQHHAPRAAQPRAAGRARRRRGGLRRPAQGRRAPAVRLRAQGPPRPGPRARPHRHGARGQGERLALRLPQGRPGHAAVRPRQLRAHGHPEQGLPPRHPSRARARGGHVRHRLLPHRPRPGVRDGGRRLPGRHQRGPAGGHAHGGVPRRGCVPDPLRRLFDLLPP